MFKIDKNFKQINLMHTQTIVLNNTYMVFIQFKCNIPILNLILMKWTYANSYGVCSKALNKYKLSPLSVTNAKCI